jgi:hypothetical protein
MEAGDEFFMPFATTLFDVKHGQVHSNSMIVKAKVLDLCVRDGRKFTKDIAHPDKKIWFVFEASIAYCGGVDLKTVWFVSDGDRIAPISTNYEIYAKLGKVPWERFGPTDQTIVKHLMTATLLGALAF